MVGDGFIDSARYSRADVDSRDEFWSRGVADPWTSVLSLGGSDCWEVKCASVAVSQIRTEKRQRGKDVL
jgi:hypothetical protein